MSQYADDFKALNADVICILREESDGVSGLKKMKERTGTPFTLALDKDKKSTKAYSTKRMTFDNFVVDKTGKVRVIVPGTLRERATAEQLLKTLKAIEGK